MNYLQIFIKEIFENNKSIAYLTKCNKVRIMFFKCTSNKKVQPVAVENMDLH